MIFTPTHPYMNAHIKVMFVKKYIVYVLYIENLHIRLDRLLSGVIAHMFNICNIYVCLDGMGQ